MEENLETRVGFKALSIINDYLTNYIQLHTVNGKYVGSFEYLVKAQQVRRTLRGDTNE